MFKRLIFLCFFVIVFSEDFSDGPYGSEYFDIAGPFELPDLNMELHGDANIDGIINIQDLISLVNAILGAGRSADLNGHADVEYIISDNDMIIKINTTVDLAGIQFSFLNSAEVQIDLKDNSMGSILWI